MDMTSVRSTEKVALRAFSLVDIIFPFARLATIFPKLSFSLTLPLAFFDKCNTRFLVASSHSLRSIHCQTFLIRLNGPPLWRV
jgi:hypothetical protein